MMGAAAAGQANGTKPARHDPPFTEIEKDVAITPQPGHGLFIKLVVTNERNRLERKTLRGWVTFGPAHGHILTATCPDGDELRRCP